MRKILAIVFTILPATSAISQVVKWVADEGVQTRSIKARAYTRPGYTFNGGIDNRCYRFRNLPLSKVERERFPNLRQVGSNIVDGGKGLEAQCRTDDAYQAEYELPKLRKGCRSSDIITIVDNSASMESLQTQFQRGAKDFVAHVMKTSAPKMYVITTDAYLSENPATGFSKAIESVAEFETAIKVGTAGSSDERPLLSMDKALKAGGSKVLRPDACLGVLILTDEDEASVANAAEIERIIADLKTLKSDSDLIRVVSFSTGQGQIVRSFSSILDGYFVDVESKEASKGIERAGRLFTEGDFMVALELPLPATLLISVQKTLVDGYVVRTLPFPEPFEAQWKTPSFSAVLMEKPLSDGERFRVNFIAKGEARVTDMKDLMMVIKSLGGHRNRDLRKD